MRKFVFVSLLTALALVLSIFEAVIPLPILVPGARLGLSNIVILSTLVVFGFRYGLGVSIAKSLLLILVTGSVTGFFYSFAGAVLSSIVMAVAIRFFMPWLSLIGVSILGSITHNISQILVASLVLNNFRIFVYLPLLMIVGLFTGYFVGLSSGMISKQLKTVLINGRR